jgi:hypothetical protein
VCNRVFRSRTIGYSAEASLKGHIKAVAANGCQLLAQGCPGLTSVNFGGCEELTDAGVLALVQGCPGLTSVNFGGCGNLTDEGVVALAQGCPGLTSVNFYGCKNLTDAGAGPNDGGEDGFTPLMTAAEAGMVMLHLTCGICGTPRSCLDEGGGGGAAQPAAARVHSVSLAPAPDLTIRSPPPPPPLPPPLPPFRADPDLVCNGRTAAELARVNGFHTVANTIARFAQAQQIRALHVGLTAGGNAAGAFDSPTARLHALFSDAGLPPPPSAEEEEIDFGEAFDEVNVCVVCLNNPIDTALVPCFHVQFCHDCAQHIHRAGGSCPACRGDIHRLQRVYL